MTPLVIDTNIALDLLVFGDDTARVIDAGLAARELQWLATARMREELARVLRYPNIEARLLAARLTHEEVLARFDSRVTLVEAAPAAVVTCTDPDDQKFIDLAVERQCLLLSKDRAVLKVRKRLAALGCAVAAVMPRP